MSPASDAAPRTDQRKQRAPSLAEAFLTAPLRGGEVTTKWLVKADLFCGYCTQSPSRWRHVSRAVFPSVVMLLVAVSAPVHAQVFEMVGVRALGMGGAFVAVADDATANYWNPAGLTNVLSSGVLETQRIETRFGLDPTLREGTRDHTTFASLAGPTVGLSYYRLRSWQVDRVTGDGVDGGTTASLTSLVTHHAGITLVQPFGPGLAVATVLKAVRGTVAVGSGGGGAPVGGLFDQFLLGIGAVFDLPLLDGGRRRADSHSAPRQDAARVRQQHQSRGAVSLLHRHARGESACRAAGHHGDSASGQLYI